MADNCTADYQYSGAYGGMLAYCRSKLGNLWFASELQRRTPGLEVAIAHPGVVASGLVNVGGGLGAVFKRKLLLSPARGAQTALTLATQPGVGRGEYYHNTRGRMALAPRRSGKRSNTSIVDDRYLVTRSACDKGAEINGTYLRIKPWLSYRSP